jgi:hypothetical protein
MKLLLTAFILFSFLTSGANLQAQWAQTGNMSSSNDYVRAITQSPSGTVTASSWNVGIFRSTNNGASWSKTSFPGAQAYHLSASPTGNFFALHRTSSSINIYRSTNDGLDWNQVYNSSRPNNFAFGGGMVFISADTIIAGMSFTLGPTIGDIGVEILKSVNGGANWTLLTLFNGAGFLNDIALGNNGKLLGATSLAGIVVSTNGGANWSTTSFTSYTEQIIKNSEGTLFLGTQVADFVTPKMWRSTDNGVSWMPIGLPQAGVEDLHINNNGILYVAGSDKIVYKSTNRGDNWTQFTNGIPSSQFIYSQGGNTGFVFAGTGSSGVYKATGATVISINGNTLPLSFTLGQNYPNPFNPSTTIKFGLSESGYVMLKVYDILGKEAAVIVNENLNAGEYNVNFNASELPGGMYFYKMSVVTADGKEFSETRKMILVK